MALDASRLVPPGQWIPLRYEDIFDRPVEMFRRGLRSAGSSVRRRGARSLRQLADAPTSIVKGAPKKQKWKEHNPEAIDRILPMIRPLMLELGYDPDD